MMRRVAIASIAVVFAAGAAQAFEKSGSAAPLEQRPAVDDKSLALSKDKALEEKSESSGLRIPGLGALGVLPKLDFGLELLYGDNQDASAVLPREEEPQIKVPMVDVMVQMPGASAKEVEERATRPMEKLLWEIPGVEYVYSIEDFFQGRGNLTLNLFGVETGSGHENIRNGHNNLWLFFTRRNHQSNRAARKGNQ